MNKEMEEDYYYDRFGVKRRKKRNIVELSEITIEEISLVDKPCVSECTVIKNLEDKKGDDKKMEEPKEKKGWENISESELTTIRETIYILGRYDLVNDLRRTLETLTKYFGEREVKKYSDKCEWTTVQNQLYGYCEDDLDFVNENIEVEKSDPNDKFPSLTRQFNLNQRRLESRAI